MSKVIGITPGPVQFENMEASDVKQFNPTNKGSTGQVLTKTASGYNWQTPSGGGSSVNLWNKFGFLDNVGTNLDLDTNYSVIALPVNVSIKYNFGSGTTQTTVKFNGIAIRNVEVNTEFNADIPITLFNNETRKYFNGSMRLKLEFTNDGSRYYQPSFELVGLTNYTPSEITGRINNDIIVNVKWGIKYEIED